MAEYYAFGHDEAESLFDDALEKACTAQDSVSLMFCGSGDARHIFTTILMMSLKEMTSTGGGTSRPSFGKKVCKNLHITMLDLKPAAIARTLLLFDMMAMYVTLRQNGTEGIEDAPIIMAYLYAGHVVPPGVNEKLQSHIEILLKTLETDDEIYNWLFASPR